MFDPQAKSRENRVYPVHIMSGQMKLGSIVVTGKEQAVLMFDQA